jgi:hypothetical protein
MTNYLEYLKATLGGLKLQGFENEDNKQEVEKLEETSFRFVKIRLKNLSREDVFSCFGTFRNSLLLSVDLSRAWLLYWSLITTVGLFSGGALLKSSVAWCATDDDTFVNVYNVVTSSQPLRA